MIRRWRFTVDMMDGNNFHAVLTSQEEVDKVLDHLYVCMDNDLPFKISNGTGGITAIVNPRHIIRGYVKMESGV